MMFGWYGSRRGLHLLDVPRGEDYNDLFSVSELVSKLVVVEGWGIEDVRGGPLVLRLFRFRGMEWLLRRRSTLSRRRRLLGRPRT